MKIDQFIAVDVSGNEYQVVITQKEISAGTLADPQKVMLGSKSARLNDGSALNPVDDDTFRIVATGTIIRRLE